MVQSILFFALGFLCAGFIALLIAPSIWRRAVALTRRRIEASSPLTLSEIQADKDRLRAEFAMSVRKLEMTVKELREKSAEQLVEIARFRERQSDLEGEHSGQGQKMADLERTGGELQTALQRSEERLAELAGKLAASEKVAGEGAVELERLGQMYEEASYAASNRQIELVARESELEKMADELAGARNQHAEALRRHKELEVELRLARDGVNVEKKKATDLERKIERLVSTLADRDDKLDRRERDIARLQQQSKDAAPATGAKSGSIDKAIAKLDVARERLESRLAALALENKRLKSDLTRRAKSNAGGRESEPHEAVLLREQMQDLAAQVVSLTAKLDGPDSSIAKALEAPQGGAQPVVGKDAMPSLADRVRALQKATSVN